MFITFEGIDGSGKTIQSKLLMKYFKKIYGEKFVVLTREPGGFSFAEKVRFLLLKEDIDSISELLFFISMRYEHMKKIILPSLKDGKIVICDRFIDSTIAYQGYGLGISLKLIKNLHNLLKIQYPDITFILDIDVKVGLSRVKEKNKYEKMSINFYNKVRNGFLSIGLKEINRCNIITRIEVKTNNQVHFEIIKIITNKINRI